jgi:hypothetical protein
VKKSGRKEKERERICCWMESESGEVYNVVVVG